MQLIIPILFYLLFTGGLVFITKKSFGKTLIMSFILSILPIYFSGIVFNNLIIGLILDILFSLTIFIFLFIYRKDKTRIKEFKNNYFSIGLYIFLLTIVIVTIWNINRKYVMWDEFSHWGKMVKEMVRLNKLYIVPESTLIAHKDYPPFIQIYEYIWNVLSFGYKESITVISLKLFEFSFLINIFDNIKLKRKSNIIYSLTLLPWLIAIIYLLLAFFDNHGILNSIYTDNIIGLLLGYVLFIILINKDDHSEFNLFYLSLLLTFMLLLKQIGLPLYILSIFFFFLNFIFNSEEKKKKYLKPIIYIIVLPVLMYLLWSAYSSKFDIDVQFNISDIDVKEVVNVIKNENIEKGYEYRSEIYNNFKKALPSYNLTISKINFNYISLSIIVLMILIVLKLIYNKQISLKTYIITTITFIVGIIGYMIALGTLYLFSFGESEGVRLASYERYMPTIIISLLVFMILVFFYFLNKKEDIQKQIYSLVSSCLIIAILLFIGDYKNSLGKILPRIKKDDKISTFEQYASDINKNTKEGSKTFLVEDNGYGAYSYYINYYLNKRGVNVKCIYYKPSYNPVHCTDEEIINMITDEYDYLYLINFPIFKSNFNNYFEGEITFGLYDVIKEGNNILFRKHLNS